MSKPLRILNAGEKFNKLTTIELSYRDDNRRVDFYKFKCECRK